MNKKRRLYVFSYIFALLFSISIVLGTILQYRGYTGYTLKECVANILVILVISVVLGAITALIMSRLEAGECKNTQKEKKLLFPKLSSAQFYWIVFIVIFAGWMPTWLAYFPTIFAYDVYSQIGSQTVLGNYTTFHPLIHTLFMGLCFNFRRAAGSRMIGMALYSFIQMLIMSGCISYAVAYMREKRISRSRIIVSIVFYALFPVNSMLAISTTKDVIFAGLMLVHVIYNFKMISSDERYFNTRRVIQYIVISTLLLLFRNNAVYAFILSLPFIIWVLQKDRRKKYFIVSALVFLLYLISSISMKLAVNADGGEMKEMLGIPLQQMARVASITGETNEYITDEVVNRYNSYNVDSVKLKVDGDLIEEDVAAFIKTWAAQGLKHPIIYIDALLQNTRGYWYVGDTSHAWIYGQQEGNGYLQSGMTGISWLMSWQADISTHSFIPQLKALYDNWFCSNEYLKVPLLSIVFCPATYFWIMIFYITYNLYRRRTKRIIPCMFMIAYWLTLLMGPCVLIRYAYWLLLCAPVMINLMIGERK